MATLIPERLHQHEGATPGEVITHRLLQSLPDDCHVWYEVIVGERNRRPDFLVLSRSRGILIVEVKDWDVESIVRATEMEFTVRFNGNYPAPKPNPRRKCDHYRRDLLEAMQTRPDLLDERDRPRIPVNYMIVFPNIRHAAFVKVGFDALIPIDNVLCKDDLSTGGLLDAFESLLPPLATPIDAAQFAALKALLRPETTVPASGTSDGGLIRDVGVVVPNGASHDFTLSEEQEQIAKTLGDGPRLLRGFAGSGKTLILLMRAKLLAANAQARGERLRLLVLCWNVSLANFLRQAFAHIQLPFRGQPHDQIVLKDAESGVIVEIMNFSSWGRAVLHAHGGARHVDANNDPTAAFEAALPRFLLPEAARYDAILVDEAQDFRPEWLRYLFHHGFRQSDPKARSFLVCTDDAQRIYRHQGARRFAWADYDIPFQGRSQVLRRVYRNSPRVWMFAGFFLGNIADYYPDDDGVADAAVSFAPRRGFDPLLIQTPTLAQQVSRAIEAVRTIQRQGYALRNVLILYPGATIAYRDGAEERLFLLRERLEAALTRAELPFTSISKDAKSKQTFDWSRETVKLSTVQSAKGLDAPAVILVGLDGFDAVGDVEGRHLLYVAMTRARDHLTILYSDTTLPMVQDLMAAARRYEKYHDHVLRAEAAALGG